MICKLAVYDMLKVVTPKLPYNTWKKLNVGFNNNTFRSRSYFHIIDLLAVYGRLKVVSPNLPPE